MWVLYFINAPSFAASQGKEFIQELQTFLEADGALSSSLDWQSLQPLQGSFLDGATRLPKQLLGMPHLFCTLTNTS